ncbi:hypothetical protein EON80_18640, partial [bacterium]
MLMGKILLTSGLVLGLCAGGNRTQADTLSPFQFGGPKVSIITGNDINSRIPGAILRSTPGKLAYTFTPPTDSKISFLNLQGMEAKESVQIVKSFGPLLHRSREKEEIWSPLFSPDGRYIAFKLGLPWLLEANYRLHVLDSQTGKIFQAYSERLTFPNFSWSPDSHSLAFVEHGDQDGETTVQFDVYIGPLTLSICDWRTGKKQKVIGNDTLGRFSWTSSGDLLYGMLAPKDFAPMRAARSSGAATPRPGVYVYSPATRSSKLLFKDAFQPQASSDRKKIAFYGSPDPLK